MRIIFKIVFIYVITILIWIAVVGHIKWYRERQKPPIEAREPIKDNILDNIHDIVHQEVETTYHNYIVVLHEGKVVDKGVIHSHSCKCKRNKTVQK